MPTLLETLGSSRLGVLFPRKGKYDIPAFVADRHSIREGTLLCHPPRIHPQGFINPGSRHVERFMAKGLDHSMQLRLGPLARQFGKKPDDSWHDRLPLGSWCHGFAEPMIVPSLTNRAQLARYRLGNKVNQPVV